jgi:hypothetical protein
MFKDHHRLTQQINRDQHDLYAAAAEPEPLTPIDTKVLIITSEVTAIVILHDFAGHMAPPKGFEHTYFPILKINFALPSGSEETNSWNELRS